MGPIIFFNTAWMERYEGLVDNDKRIYGGGSFIEKNGYGVEIYYFKKIRRKVYGFAQSNGDINIQKLGADKQDDHISGVLIIFTAKSRVVGWYKDAILYKTYQDTELQERKFKDGYMGYYAVADVKNIRLLSIDERNIFPKVPRGKGGMGQSNIWYADSGKGIDYKNNILKYIKKDEDEKNRCTYKPVSHQTDVILKKRIEKIAIKLVEKTYRNRGFFVNSCEIENLGWDLNAILINEKISLHLEVKGTSERKIAIQLTPNEYSKMEEQKNIYRLCIVVNCLDKPMLYIFSYSTEANTWLSENGESLIIDQVISAKCYV